MIPRTTLRPGYEISRIIKGGWHLAGDHGAIDRAQAIKDMAAFVEAGITTFDCADIYTGVEQMIGDFRRAEPGYAAKIRVHTKFVPDLHDLAIVDGRYVETIIDRSLARLGAERLDLVQFHWWDYATPRYVETALELERLRQAGKIAHIGVTNFAVPQLTEIVAAGVRPIANQLQYSLLDRRPENGMTDFCRAQDIGLLCYGTLAGGFFSERWLGAEAPSEIANRSLIKYRLIIDEFGGWEAFQALLGTLDGIARKHDVGIGSVAVRAVLDRPGVAAAIVGATSTAHLDAHRATGALALDDDDRAAIAAAVGNKGPAGDVYTLERDREGPHGRIMKYELNKA